MSKLYDVIIVGGGMVGLAMAAALAKINLSIALVEKNNFDDLKNTDWLSSNKTSAEDYALRVSAISPGNQQFLSELNCWQNIPTNRLADYEKMFVWDGDGSGEIQFDAAETGQKKLGSIVENQVLRAAILARLETYPNLTFFNQVEIDSIVETENQVEISFISDSIKTNALITDKPPISAKLLIGADGAFSSVRQKLAITNHSQPYQQIAFVANVRSEKPHQNTAWQRFTQSGPVAFLPLADPNCCSIVWSLDEDKAKKISPLTSKDFVCALNNNFEKKLGHLTAISQFQGFPLIKRHADTYLRNRCALIGDAAHTIHPLAGLGVNLGFQDVACLSELLSKLILKNRDIGLLANLRPFERQRKAENTLTQEAMSGFKWLFGNQSLPTTLLRNWGLSAVNKSDWLKQFIIQRALN